MDEGEGADRLGGFRLVTVLLCAGILFMDGIDAQATSYAAPSLRADWRLTPGELGSIFSSSLFGILLGALFLAPIADRIGRRPVILAGTLVVGLFTLATAFAGSQPMLLALRFVTGLGLGAAMPNAVALTSEYAPIRRRAVIVSLMFSGFTLGAITGGLVAHETVPTYGWRSVFLVGGALTLAFVPFAFWGVPESLRFLRARGGAEAAIARLVARTGVVEASPEDAGRSTGVPVGELFTQGRALRTILLWVVFFMSLLDLYMLVNWLPTALNQAGASVQTAILVSTIMQSGGLVGAWPLGALVDRQGARATLFPSYLLAAVCIAGIGLLAGESLALATVAAFGAGFGIIGGQAAMNAVASGAYPTSARATGVGWALGIGRIGSIVGPMVGAALMGAHVSTRDIFLLSAIPAAVAAAALLGLGIVDPMNRRLGAGARAMQVSARGREARARR
jgi:AAHS family 4-hydroxybenzoate transporter-like MFS transporter